MDFFQLRNKNLSLKVQNQKIKFHEERKQTSLL